MLLNSTTWLDAKNEVEEMEEDKGHFVGDYIIDNALDKLKRNMIREITASMPASKLL